MIYTNEPLHQYKPYKYPPDYDLARLHQKASIFGKEDPNQPKCPCCGKRPKIPYKTWWSRSLQNDYKQFGGAVVSYFWLLKLYLISTSLIIIIYGIYLQYLNEHFCSQLNDEAKKAQVCSDLLGFSLIASNDLHDLMEKAQDNQSSARFSLLRSMTFVILLLTNLVSLYVMKWFKVRYPDQITLADFSLIFKNLKTNKIQDLLQKLREQFGDFEIKQAFIFKQLQPYYSKNQQKLNIYYEYKIEKNEKKKIKLLKKLKQLHTFCLKHQKQFLEDSKRGLIVFNQNQIRNKILIRYEISKIQKIKMFFNNAYEEERALFCQQCPRSDQFIWNNMGKCEKQGFLLKVKSIIYFFGLLAIIYLLLHFSFQVMYSETIVQPFTSIITFVTLFVMTVMALVFRFLMDYLSDLRFPNTYTQRTMYIIVTTVLFHFIYYLFIPTIYLWNQQDLRGSVLKLIAKQSLFFVLFHIIFCSIDIIHCLWSTSKKKVQDEQNPIGCQKILHSKIQLPRFPLEMKLIVMFKFWSLCMFFAFQTPLVLFCLMAVMVLHYVKDKYNLYYHYHTEVIQNKVQFNFLRIYVNIFAIFMYIIFVATQRSELQLVVSSIMTGITIIFQTYYFKQYKKKKTDQEDQDEKPKLLKDFQNVQQQSFQQKYDKFIQLSHDEDVNQEIKAFLSDKSLDQQRQSILTVQN